MPWGGWSTWRSPLRKESTDDNIEILERWAQYTKFDPGQTRFNLLTSEYTLNRCNKRIQELLSNYDPSGTLAVVYAKNICRELLQEKKLTLFDALTELDKYQETKEIWEMFSSQEVRGHRGCLPQRSG